MLTEQEIVDNYLEADYVPGRRGYFSRGVYAPQVENYLSLFGDDYVKVVFLEELVKNQSSVLRDTYKFLDISLNKGFQKLPPASNTAVVWRNPAYRFLLKNPQFNRVLPKHARRFFLFGKRHKFKYDLPNEDLMKRLNDFYDPYNFKLASLLGRDLPW